MPPSSNRDIYSSHPQRKSPLEGSRPSPKAEWEWFQKSSGVRWSAAIFLLMILLFFAFLVAVILYQQQRIQEPGAQPSASLLSFQASTATVDPMQSDLDPEGSLILDEWLDRGPAPIGDGPSPLTAEWIQEAALHLRRAEAAYRAGQWRLALDHYESASRIFPDIEGISVQRGLAHLRLREFAEAEALFISERDRAPPKAGVLNNLAVAQMGQKRDDTAEAHLRAAVDLDPEYLPARHNLALLYYRTGNLPEAADAFRAVYARKPLNPEHIHLYALTLLKLERWRDAALVLQESIRRYPQAPPIRFRLAEALAHTADPTVAVEALREAVALVDARYAMRWISRSEFDSLRPRPEFEQLVAELAGAMP